MSTFYRWVPRAHVAAALAAGLESHNTSAMWIFDMSGDYRPGMARGAILIAYELDETATFNLQNVGHLNFENETFRGEAKHPMSIIVKNNERGAYGLGKMRQGITNMHCTTRLANEAEVRRALKASKQDDISAYKPDGGWGR